MRSIRNVTALGVALLGVLVTRAAAQGGAKPTVAIMYFNNNALMKHDDYEPLRVGMDDILITEMRGNPNIVVVERDQLNKILAEQNLVTEKRVDAGTAARIGKILGAQHMIFGGFIVDPKGTLRIDARAVNVETSQVEYGETVSGKADDLLDVVASLARKFNAGLKLPASERPSRPTGGAAPAGGKYQAIMLYSRALVEDDKKNTKLAAQYYRQFLDATPATFAVDQRQQSENRLKALGGS